MLIKLTNRTDILFPICLPEWDKVDIMGERVDRLYKSRSEKYHIMYSLKVILVLNLDQCYYIQG